MRYMYTHPYIVVLALVIAVGGCGADRPPAMSTPTPAADTSAAEAMSAPADTMAAVAAADSAVQALARADWQALASLVHPDHGVRFSPYAYVDTAEHVVLGREELVEAAREDSAFVWGAYDGSGHTIRGTLADYRDEFLYDRDFTEARRGEPGEILRTGNTRNNIEAVYGNGMTTFVSYHVPGTDEYEGMDWASLRVVLQHQEGKWYVVGLVHDQWTI